MQPEETTDSVTINNFSAKLNKCIKGIVDKEGYITYNIEKRKLESGYTGTVLAIDVKGKTKQEDKETHIFVKQIVAVDIPIYDVQKIYKREAFVYTDLFREMYDLQKKENVPVAERFRAAKAFDECNDKEIILDNLVVRGFKTPPKMGIVKLEYAELVFKNLARLHGLSLAMEVKRPDFFEKNIKNLDCAYNFNDFFRGFTHNMRESVMKFLAVDVREKVAYQLEKLVDKYPSYMNDVTCQIKTICHGDHRHSNIMVKETDDKPTEVIAVDYQITFFGNPVLDFIYFIFWGTDQEFRKKHLDHLKQLYYQYLGTFLGYFDIEVERVFPKDEFERQYKEKLDFGLMIAVMYLPHLFPPQDELPHVSKGKEPLDEGSFKVGTEYAERFRGIIDDYIQWGYLK